MLAPKTAEPATEARGNTHVVRIGTDAEQTAERALLPGVVGYQNAVAKLRRGELTYHQFRALMNVARPDFRERLRTFLDTIMTGFYGAAAHHRKR
jgi:hypothetical protein